MKYLLDVNVLIALLDQDHLFHERAEEWFEAEAGNGWATCPITENGVLRIIGSPRYPKGPGTPAAVVGMVAALRALPAHEFWPDEISILESDLVDPAQLGNSASITDTYLLALAVHWGGRLASFDQRLSFNAVRADTRALHLIR